MKQLAAMATFTFTGMRNALPRVAPFTASRPQPSKLALPSFSGMRLSKGLPMQAAGAMAAGLAPLAWRLMTGL